MPCARRVFASTSAVASTLQFDPSSSGSGRSYRWWEEAELRDLVSTVGLTDFQRERRLRFIMFSAKKPGSNNNGG